jgi:hypothetical protein
MRRPDDRESFEVKSTLNALGNRLAVVLPSVALESYRGLIAVGEAKVALENLCMNLGDLQLELGFQDTTALRQACELVGVEGKYWKSPTDR